MAYGAEDLLKPGLAPEAPSRPSSQEARQHLAALAETLGGQRAAPAYSAIVLAGIVRLVEFVLIVASGLVVRSLYVVPWTGHGLEYAIAVSAIAIGTLIVSQCFHLYQIAAFRAPLKHGFALAASWTLVIFAALAIVFFFDLDFRFSRVWLVSWFATGLAILLAERAIVSFVVRSLIRAGRLDRRTVVVGGGDAASTLLRDLTRETDTGVRIYGFFDDRVGDRSPDILAGFPKLGTVDDLVDFARSTRIDLVILAMPITAEARVLAMLRKLWVLPVDIRLAAHTNKLRFRPRSYSYVGRVPVLDVFDKPIADWDVVAKTIFDKIVATACLVILAPVLLAVALAVKLDSRGPVLFRQRRYGFNNEPVEIYKFRSMYADQADYQAVRQVTRGDPRVTRVGRFIRRTSLDELPQLLNVIFHGNLSLVGPRPHALRASAAERQYEEVVDGYFARHRVKPGLTGWAQVNGWRGETDTPEKIQRRVEHDLYYIENWSILLDLYILAVTPFALVKGENAY